ncbi:MAG: hypothetical protein E6R03_15515 [Hyphomicrobiaceae bacterium]|nr:MAG: hypothetical protein E6R03_15515 [Hyphomicrobiaceae bacterium]
MPILGMRNDEQWITNQRPQNWRETILMLYPNSSELAKAPLTALTSMMKSESTDDPVFHWFEKHLQTRRLALTADITNSATSISVNANAGASKDFDNAFSVKAGDMLLAEQTGEIMRVSADPSANNAITVTRAQAGTSGTAITFASSNPYLTVIGSAYEEGSLAPSGINFDPVEVYNYTQIFRSALEITRTAEKTRLRTGDQVKEAKRECLEYFSIDMERAFWFNGGKTLVTINSKPARLTAGIIKQITDGAPSNIVTAPADGLIDMDWLEEKTQQLFKYGSSEKLCFGGNAVLAAFQSAVRKNSSYQITTGLKEYGMRVSRFVTPFGEIVFKTHPLFNQMAGGTANDGTTAFLGKANNAYFLDMANVRYRYVTDVQYQKDLTPVGLDGMKSGYIAECGLELHHALTHGAWIGVKGGKADGA